MLEAEAVTIRAGKRTLLDAVSFAIRPGEFVAVVGPNGAGKSTLLKVLAGEILPASGRTRLDGADIRRMPPGELAIRRAVLPQAASLAFPFTVHEVVRLGIGGAVGVSQRAERVTAALARVDLAGFGGRFFQELSGGEQQRVHLARVLCQVWEPVRAGVPRYLLLDEPTASLDLRHQLMTLDTAHGFARAGGGVLAILHDLNLAARYADRIVVIRHGTVAAFGTPAEVVTDDMMRSVFGVALRVGRPPTDGTPYVLPQGAAAA